MSTGLIAVMGLRSIRLDERGRLVWATVVREVPTRMRTVVNNIYVRRRVDPDHPRTFALASSVAVDA